MRVLLINSSFPVYMKMPAIPLGLLSIASCLKADGHSVLINDRTVGKKQNIHKLINEFRPDIVGISVLSLLSADDAKRITDLIHKSYAIPVVWGGNGPTLSPDMILREADPDLIVYGEGELTWSALVEALEQKSDIYSINGLIYKKGNQIIKNPPQIFADLSKLPEMEWDLIRVEDYFSSFPLCKKMQYLHASKGCPGQCTFCANKALHNRRNRCRNPESIVRDMTYLYEHGADGIYFSDELFLPKRDVRERFCNLLIEKKWDRIWGCMMSVGVLNKDDMQLMYDAGCRWILFGIETGSVSEQQKIKKNLDLELAKKNLQWCSEVGITVIASMIIGYPDETVEELKQSLAYTVSLAADILQVCIFTPLPGAELYDRLIAEKRFKEPKTINQAVKQLYQATAENVVGDYSAVPDKDLKVIHHYFQWLAFIDKRHVKGKSYAILKKMVADTFVRIFSNGITGFFYGAIMSVKQFFTVYFFSHAYPRILRKYGLK